MNYVHNSSRYSCRSSSKDLSSISSVILPEIAFGIYLEIHPGVHSRIPSGNPPKISAVTMLNKYAVFLWFLQELFFTLGIPPGSSPGNPVEISPGIPSRICTRIPPKNLFKDLFRTPPRNTPCIAPESYQGFKQEFLQGFFGIILGFVQETLLSID